MSSCCITIHIYHCPAATWLGNKNEEPDSDFPDQAVKLVPHTAADLGKPKLWVIVVLVGPDYQYSLAPDLAAEPVSADFSALSSLSSLLATLSVSIRQSSVLSSLHLINPWIDRIVWRPWCWRELTWTRIRVSECVIDCVADSHILSPRPETMVWSEWVVSGHHDKQLDTGHRIHMLGWNKQQHSTVSSQPLNTNRNYLECGKYLISQSQWSQTTLKYDTTLQWMWI